MPNPPKNNTPGKALVAAIQVDRDAAANFAERWGGAINQQEVFDTRLGRAMIAAAKGEA